MSAEEHKADIMEDDGDRQDDGGSLSLGVPVSKKHLLILGVVAVAAAVAWKLLRDGDDGGSADNVETTDTGLDGETLEERLQELDDSTVEGGASDDGDSEDGDGGGDVLEDAESFEEEQERVVDEMSEDKPEFGGGDG